MYASGGGYQAVYNQAIIHLNPGDVVVGVVDSSGQGMTCSDSTSESGSQGYGTLSIANVGEMPQAVLTLEAYNLLTCSDYPNTVSSAFTGIHITTHGGSTSLNWASENRVTDCHQHTIVVSDSDPGGEVDLYYRNPPLVTGISGPATITQKGSYTWTATPSGGSGSYSYQWWEQIAGGTRYTLGTTQNQSFIVSQGPNLWVVVSVNDGTSTIGDSVYVTDCMGQGSGCIP